jgi:hypothetical protein
MALRNKLLPKGWRIENREELEYLRPDRDGKVREVKFTLVEVAEERAFSGPTVRWDRSWEAYVVTPGAQTGQMDADEARARAVSLLEAADKADRLNKIPEEGR